MYIFANKYTILMFQGQEIDDIIKTRDGDDVFSYEYIDYLREEDKKSPNPYIVIPQNGCQEMFLACNSDIVFYGGKRGGGKIRFNKAAETLTRNITT